MPCINRIRIINFSYNNDVRHILDETFDFHGGENALLNLSNGGGKSVLVQLMLQPVVPRAKIQGRNIADFFKRQKRPAYVLIEWKLDGAGGYLLTGIALASEETRSADEDEQGRVRLFTFLCTYSRSGTFDLANIELVRHEDGIVQITPYKAAQDMMREAARKDPYAISYFSQSEKEEHRRKLLQFGISPDEWSNVMKRINDSEGGLEEIFAKCKTSDQLLDTWLIHTIEKNLPADVARGDREGAAAGSGLRKMFENLLEETLNSEGLLMEQQRLAAFLPEFEALREQASDLAGRLEQLKTTGAELSAMHGWLGKQVVLLETNREGHFRELQGVEAQYVRLTHEELSAPVHAARTRWETAAGERAGKEESLRLSETAVAEREVAFACMKAARVSAERERLSAALAEVAARMRGLQERDDRVMRMEQLRTTLWVRWEERLAAQRELVAQAAQALAEAEAQKGQLQERISGNRREQVRLESEMKRLSVAAARFEERERQVLERLGLALPRDLGGELPDKDRERAASVLAQRRKDAESALAARLREQTELVASLQRLEAEVSREAATQQDCADEQRELERELEQWRLRTEERLDVLRRNNMSGSESRDMALSELRRIKHDLVRRISLTEQQHHEAASLQEDLRNGRFHVSADWVRQLTEADVAHQTGESYLREAAPAERERLLQQLPFLPYAILMTTASLAELPEKLKTEVRRGVAPFLTYEGLRELAGRDESERDVTGHDEPGHDAAGHDVVGHDVVGRDEPGNGVSEAGILPAAWAHRAYMMRPGSLLLATLYNREALAPESVGRLLEETAHALSRLTASIENLRLAHQTATRDLQLLEAYAYPEEWKQVQDAKLARALEKGSAAGQRVASLKDAIREKDAQKNRLLGALIPQAQKAVDAAVEQGSSWQTLMQGNDQYETDRKQLNTLDAHLRALTGEADELRKALDDLDGVNGQEGTLRKLDRACADAERTERETRVKRDRYAEWAPNRLHREARGVPDKSSREVRGVPESNEQGDGTQAGSDESALPLLDGNCETLEGQLSELENTFGMEQKQLQHRLDELKQDADRQEKIWRKLPEAIRLKEDLPVWDESTEDRLEAEVNEAKAELEREKQTLQAAQMQEIKMTERLNAAREKLVGAGFDEPLPEGELSGHYSERRKAFSLQEGEHKQAMKAIEDSLKRIGEDRRRITDAGIEPGQVQPAASLLVVEDGKAQLESLLKALRMGRDEAATRKEAFRIRYDKARNAHAVNSELIRNLFDGLNAMLERTTDNYEPFYFLYERMADHAGILSQQISMLKARLEGLDRSRTDVVEHCFMHGRRMVEELGRIEKNSVVRLEGRATPTSMLKVLMNPVQEAEARERMVQHVGKSIELMKEEVRSGKETRQARPAIERLIRSRELLNQYLGTTRIPVQVFKIDLSMGNSRLKYWEDAVRENSGGEKFVVYFSVLTALMAYTRAAEQMALAAPGDSVSRESRHVLIMDNPFGPISSMHLLKPLFDIAKRYRTQLICLTDLKQSSILNNFNLVYMLRIRKGAASSDEYLKWEALKRSEEVPETDEALEKAFYRVSDFTQMTLGE
jgi:hypothetical protein